MASGSSSSSAFDFRRHSCVTCDIAALWTPRMWECDVCRDYFLCESCHKRSLDGPEVLSAPPEVHNRGHPMSPHVMEACCDGCGSNPIWNLCWHCTVCVDFDLCEACYEGLDAGDMPPEHSKEHPMIPLEVFCSEMLRDVQPNFSKPVDPQWSYQVNVDGDWLTYGFKWVKKKAVPRVLSGMDDAGIHTGGNAAEDNSVPGSKLKQRMSSRSKNSPSKQALETTQTHWMLDSKHKIFLSHAGTEKDFVEQLYRDLLRVHHFGIFFDKDDKSLPIAEAFPKRIFDAAKHCELAIVVISHEYFIRKWPMLELAAFVKAQKIRPELKILPLFYKLSIEEVKNQQELFWRSWNEMGWVSKDEMQEWKEALKVIFRTRGLEYDKKVGEVAYRDRIVEKVYERVNPGLMWDDSRVQGKTQMQETIQERIQMSRNVVGIEPSTSTLQMGLFGMGGLGKTTMCKVFYNQMMPHYLGKVCHIEFGSGSLLDLRLKLLRSLCQLDSNLLQDIDEGSALTLLKSHLPQQRVCLIIDNVCGNASSIDEARVLLNLPFKDGSLVLVTSRSPIILENLKIEKRLIMRVPSLKVKQAKALFSQHAGCDTSSLTKEQMEAMENFVEQCNFKAKDMTSKEYHPLALKVLGVRVGPNVEEWQNIGIDFKYYENENIHPIFSILRSSFDALNLKYQRIFLDIVLYSSNWNITPRIGYLWAQMRCLYGEANKQFSFQVLKVLQAKSLVEYYDEDSHTIYVHDLYREFATMEVEKKGLQHSPRCCFSRGSKCEHVQERRVRIHDHPISHITKDILSCVVCSEAELLSVQDCANLISIDVPGMQNLKMFHVVRGCRQLTSVNLEGAINLKSIVWDGFEGEYPDLTSLESLEELRLDNNEGVWPKDDELVHSLSLTFPGCLDFSKSSNLEVLRLSHLPDRLLNFNQAILLKLLFLDNCQHLERFGGLESLVQLESVSLRACSSLVEFPSLANFPSLEAFCLHGATKLKVIDGFASLTALQSLSLADGVELEELPGIEACTRLRELFLTHTSIRDCSWITAMNKLMRINLSGSKIRFVPDCNGLYNLSDLFLNGCQALESIGDKAGPIPPMFPHSLQRFSAQNCESLNAIPQFHHESALRYLDLDGTCVEDVSSVACCKELQTLLCMGTDITSLPNLSSLTRLEVLAVPGCELLTRMDNTKSLPALEHLYVSGCTNLLALPDLRSSTRLAELCLYNCPMLDPKTVKLPIGSIDDMDMEDTTYSNWSDDVANVQEHENETLAMTNFQAPELAHNLEDLPHSLTWWQWVGSWCNGLDIYIERKRGRVNAH